MKKILITGAKGLMGQYLREVLDGSYEVYALDKYQLDITDREQVLKIVGEIKPGYIINAAAFTNVDQAEIKREQAYAVNVSGVENIMEAAKEQGSIPIHFSTDYVFDGKKSTPYNEDDPKNPLNYYGLTKHLSEEKIVSSGYDKYFIIRPAWIYGKYGNNFFHLILKLAEQNEVLRIANDQTGSPTYARDLAMFIKFLIDQSISGFGIYHFSNEGSCTRYEQAKALMDLLGIKKKIIPVPSSVFKPLARRPAYSVLSKEKVKKQLDYPVPHWKDSLEQFIKSDI